MRHNEAMNRFSGLLEKQINKNRFAGLSEPDEPNMPAATTDEQRDKLATQAVKWADELELPDILVAENYDEIDQWNINDPHAPGIELLSEDYIRLGFPVTREVQDKLRQGVVSAAPYKEGFLSKVFGYEAAPRPEAYWDMNAVQRAGFDVYMAGRHILTRAGGMAARETGLASKKDVQALYQHEFVNEPEWYQKSPEIVGWGAEKVMEYYALKGLFKATGLHRGFTWIGQKLAHPFIATQLVRQGAPKVAVLSKAGLKKVTMDGIASFLRFAPENTAFLGTWSASSAALKGEDIEEAAWSGSLWGIGLSAIGPIAGGLGKVGIATKTGQRLSRIATIAYRKLWVKYPRLMNAGKKYFSEEFRQSLEAEYKARFGVEPTARDAALMKKLSREMAKTMGKAAERDAAMKAYWESGKKAAKAAKDVKIATAKTAAEAAKGELALRPPIKPPPAAPIKDGLAKAMGEMMARPEPPKTPEDAYIELVNQPELFHSPSNAMPEVKAAFSQEAEKAEAKEPAKPTEEAEKKPPAGVKEGKVAELQTELRKLETLAPRMSEGAISATQLNRMSKRQRQKYDKDMARRYEVEAEIKELQKTPEQKAKEAKAVQEKKTADRLLQIKAQIDMLQRTGIGKRGIKPSYQKRIDILEAERKQLQAPPPAEPAGVKEVVPGMAEVWQEVLAGIDKTNPDVQNLMKDVDAAFKRKDLSKFRELSNRAKQLVNETGKNEGLFTYINTLKYHVEHPPPPAAPAGKEAWEMTRGEFEKEADLIHGTDESGAAAIEEGTFDKKHKIFKFEPAGLFALRPKTPKLAQAYAEQRARATGKKPIVVYGMLKEGAKVDIRDQANIIIEEPSDFVTHRQAIKQALSEGQPVPQNVLQEYAAEEWAQEALTKKPTAEPIQTYERLTRKWSEDIVTDAQATLSDENETYQEIEGKFVKLDQQGKGDTPEAKELETKLFRMVDEHLTAQESVEGIATIDTSIGQIQIPAEELKVEQDKALEVIFDYGNQAQAGKPEQPDLTRSLSMGDTVEYEGKTWLVMPEGWQDVSQLSQEQIDKIVGEAKIPEPEVEIRDLSGKTRKAILKDIEARIVQHDLYQFEEQALTYQQHVVGSGPFLVSKTEMADLVHIIGEVGARGYKAKLAAMFTTDPSKSKLAWDVAKDQAAYSGLDAYELARSEIQDMGIEEFAEFIERSLGEVPAGEFSETIFQSILKNRDPYLELLAMKRQAIKDGLSAKEINDSLNEWLKEEGKHYGVSREDIADEFVPVERVKYVEKKPRVAKEVARKAKKAPVLAEQKAIKKAQQLAYKNRQTMYVYEKTGVDVGLFGITKRKPTKGEYTKIVPPKPPEIKFTITKERAGPTVEQEEKMKRLRQQIHALAIKKGLTKKQLSELKLKHGGARLLAGKRKVMDIDQLQAVLKAVQRARPKRIGHRHVIRPKTEKAIQGLKENLIKKAQMNEEAYKSILDKEVHGKEPRYIDAEHYITEQEGKAIIGRLNITAEIVRTTESFERAIGKNAEIADQVKAIDSKIKGQKRRDPSTLESMRYYAQQSELKTGAPISAVYDDLNDTHLAINKSRAAIWKQLENTVGKATFKRISADPDALQRISDYITSQSQLKDKPPMPENITPEETAVAKHIQKIFKSYEFKIRTAKFYNWYYHNQPIPDHDQHRKEITKAVDIYESRGADALVEYLKTQEWGVIGSGYDPMKVLRPKIRTYDAGPTMVGKSHIQIRTDIEYHRQEQNILQRLAAYMRQVDMLYNLSPKINALVQLYQDNAAQFKDWPKVRESVQHFLRNLKRYNAEGGFFERMIARAYSQAMRVIIMPSPVLSFRNLLQNAAFEHDKTVLFDPRNKPLTDEDVEYIETYVQQIRAMIEEYFMVGEKPFAGLRFLTHLIDKVKIYPYSDVANRYWGFWAKINQVRRATQTAKTIEEMMKLAKFDDMTQLEQRRALAILARDGKEAMARYVARVHVNNIHFLYERSQRSPAEMTTLGRTFGNLMLFPRAYVEKLSHATAKLLDGEATHTQQYRALKTILAVVGGGMIVGSVYQKVTGRKRNPYNPLEIVSYEMGGLATESVESINEIYTSMLSAVQGDQRALGFLTTAIPAAADMWIPFYNYTLRAIEACSDTKNIDRKALRQLRELIDKEYEHRPDAYKLERNALEKWQYFLGGAGVDEKIKGKKEKARWTR